MRRALWGLLLPLLLLSACTSGGDTPTPAITCPAGVNQSGPACQEAGATCTYAGCSPSCPGECRCEDGGWICGCVPCPGGSS